MGTRTGSGLRGVVSGIVLREVGGKVEVLFIPLECTRFIFNNSSILSWEWRDNSLGQAVSRL